METTLHDYLKTQSVAVLSTISPAGFPQAATIFFTPRFTDGENFELYFATREHTRKYANLAANPNVAMVIGMDFKNPYTVQLQGVAELVKKGGDESAGDFLWRFGDAMTGLAKACSDSFFSRAFLQGSKGLTLLFSR